MKLLHRHRSRLDDHQGGRHRRTRTILGRRITNSRSNYDTAAAVAKAEEALVNSRFHLFRRSLDAGALERRRRLLSSGDCASSSSIAQLATSKGDLPARREPARSATPSKAAVGEALDRRDDPPAADERRRARARRGARATSDIAGSQLPAHRRDSRADADVTPRRADEHLRQARSEVENRVEGGSIRRHRLGAEPPSARCPTSSSEDGCKTAIQRTTPPRWTT